MDIHSFSGTSSTKSDGLSQGSSTERWAVHHEKEPQHRGRIALRVTIGSLPDDVLLDVFDFYRHGETRGRNRIWKGKWQWQTLAHVCSRWRHIIFASPRRLDPRLVCTEKTPVKEMLDAFPNFPISITYWHNTLSRYDACDYEDLDNILAALEHRDQARYILLHLTGVLSRVSARRMKEPFPSLTHLQFESSDDDVKAVPIIPDTFLGRSAPRLQSLILEGIAFPGLPKLLFSTRDLVSLYLTRVSISPEALADGLSTLPRLESLTIGDPSSHPDQTSRRPPPLTRTILPSLTCLEFNGTSEYLQGLVAPISAPLLDDVNIDILFSEVQPTSDTQLIRLIGQSENLKSPSQVAIQFEKGFTRITLRSPRPHRCAYFVLNIECEESAWRASLAAQFCSQSLPLLREVVRLTLTGSGPYPPDWQDQMSQAQWPEIFRPFTAVERSSTSDQVASLLVPTLSALTEERAGQVLPALHSIFLEDFKPHGSVYDAIMPFVTARRLCGHPVCVHPWLRVRPHDLWDD